MAVGKGMLAASNTCWILRSDGHAADPIGKDCRTPMCCEVIREAV